MNKNRQLKLLYPSRNLNDIYKDLSLMIDSGWLFFLDDECLVLYKLDKRLHCGDVVIIDTLISTKKGQGSRIINLLKQKYISKSYEKNLLNQFNTDTML